MPSLMIQTFISKTFEFIKLNISGGFRNPIREG
jgi:hypothetical protein